MGAVTILLVENTRAKRPSFADALKKRYQVVSAASGKQAVSLAADRRPQVVILDAISMRTPGDRVCRLLRNQLPHIGIIHLHPGPKDNQNDSPADVILYEPFTARKLTNCIERLLEVSDEEFIICGPFTMNVARRVLIVHGQETYLTPKLALLVELFLRNPGQTMARKTLMEQVWQTDYLGDTRTLDVHIRWFRRAIETDPGHPRYLKTVRGVGYRLDTEPTSVLMPVPEVEIALP